MGYCNFVTMAHGNTSDLVWLLLVAVVVQWWGFPDTLYQDLGPFKAQFTTKSADMNALIKLGAGLLLTQANAFSGVRWNPINGKMAGLGGFIAVGCTVYTQFKADKDAFVPRLFYVYAAVLLLGALHIFAFPSNPLPEKTKDTKNNHGNASDAFALGLIGSALACFFYPDHLFQDVGPLKSQLSAQTADVSAMVKFVAGLFLMLGLTFSGVKWNPINGKMAGLAGFIAAGYTAYFNFKADGGHFVPRLFYVHAAILFLGALHIFFFPSNPLLTKPADDKKEQ